MRVFFLSTWRSGLRGHSFHAVFVLGILLIAGAYLASLFSPRQPETVALDVGISGMRFALILMALLWIQEMVGKEIDRRTTVLYLSYPISRSDYIWGRFLGVALLLLVATLVLGLLLWLSVLSASELYNQAHHGSLGLPYWTAMLGLWLEATIVAAFALCIATLSTTPILPMVLGAAFAVAGQSIGAVTEYLSRGADGLKEVVDHYAGTVEVARWVLPDLSRLDWRIWPMYDQPISFSTLGFSCMMALSYIVLMLLVAIQAFKNREFD